MGTHTGRSENKQGVRTREAILDAAEALFGQRNFDSVSVRDIAHQAEVLPGSLSHHFKSKEALFRDVATRRAEAVNRQRLDSLQSLETPGVVEIIDAFARPALELHTQPEWRHYLNIVSQIAQEERWQALDTDLFLDTAQAFLTALQAALPNTDPDLLRVSFQHGISVLLSALSGQASRLNNLGLGEQTRLDTTVYIDSIVSFIAGGICASAKA